MTIGKHMRRKKPLREREPSLYRQAYAAKQKQRETWVSSFLSVWRQCQFGWRGLRQIRKMLFREHEYLSFINNVDDLLTIWKLRVNTLRERET